MKIITFCKIFAQAFAYAYRESLAQSRALSEQQSAMPKGKPQEDEGKRQLSTMEKVTLFLTAHYSLRHNVLSGATEFARRLDRNGNAIEESHLIYKVVDDRSLNGFSLAAMREGINCWDRDINRFVNSDEVDDYHPFTDYLNRLPEWDGVDRVTPLAHLISTKDAWTRHFHTWMLAMVAQWMNMGDGLHANAVAPLIVSKEQGWGKSTFCRMLMPDELSRYYAESYDLSHRKSAETKLSLFGLINLDEFDSISPKRHPMLKNLMQMSSLNIRKVNCAHAQQLHRIASFIGTSNRKDLLTDLSGSRRFICVEMEKSLSPTLPQGEGAQTVEGNQAPFPWGRDGVGLLYSQLKAELLNGTRYWFTKEDETEIQENNREFYKQSIEEDVFNSVFEPSSKSAPDAQLLTAAEIYRIMKKSNPAALRGTTAYAFSRMLPSLAQRVRRKDFNGYWVKRKSRISC